MKTMQKILFAGSALLLAAVVPHCAIQTPDNQPTFRLEVSSDASLGSVVSDLQGIDCGSSCAADYPQGYTVTLTATPLAGIDTAFLGWDGACTGTDATCAVTMDQSRSVTAKWKMPPMNLPAPTVSSVLPAGAANNGTTSLTIVGDNFRSGATVSIGGVACTQVSVRSRTHLTCSYPGKAATCGGQSITVTHPDDSKSGTLAAAQGLFLRPSALAFAPAVNYAAGTGPRMAALGDLNGDQRPDLAIPNANSDNISVFLGNANGTFGSATNVSVAAGSGPQASAIADLNGDNQADLVVSNASTNNVTVFLGNGMGGFGTPTNFAVGMNPASILVADLNGDNKPDIITANFSGGNVSVLLNNGNGSFGAASNFNVGAGPRRMAVGDFTGDGKPDLAVPNSGADNVSLLVNNGSGSFAPAVNFGVGAGPHSAVAGDFNGDGRLDLAVANSGTTTVSVLLGNGASSFATATPFTVGNTPFTVVAADFDRDGKLDLATANFGSNNVSILLGNGAGSFAAAASFAAGSAPHHAVIGDAIGN